jgi:hypothetical protein
MCPEPAHDAKEPVLRQTGVRWLTADKTRIFQGTYSLLHCTVEGGSLYRGVFAVMLFPISHPDRFISLRYTDLDDKVAEIGVIENLKDFPAEAQRLVRDSLVKQAYEKIVTRIHEVREHMGLLFFDVETQDGREQFVMPWRYDRAEDYSTSGKLLLDAFDNRYVIPDVSQLPPADQRRLTSFIYW